MSKQTFDTIYYIIAMLEKYNITNIVASPGTQNAQFNILVQENKKFNCISVVDERSAAYVASGIAYETNEPVVITCTEATASRNYLSALTEAYYKGLPIIALTFYNPTGNNFNLAAQYIDRSVSQNDVKILQINLPKLNDLSDKKNMLDSLNAALSTAKYKKMPVHINCPAYYNFKNLQTELPTDIWTTECYFEQFEKLQCELNNKNAAIYIGSHLKFNKETQDAISEFAISWNIPVICDHTSNYHGKNKILAPRLATMIDLEQKPELVIDIGNVSGDYYASELYKNAKVWRVADNQNFQFRFSIPVEKTFICSEKIFFESLTNNNSTNSKGGYYEYLKSIENTIEIPELPLSTPLIAFQLAKLIPQNSSLHLAILNSLRAMNFFDINETIDINCNVGGFGIDGAISTAVGQSLINKNKKVFCLAGDLAFFYDMNIIGNKNISKNFRVLVVNNGKGEEFRLNPLLEKNIGNKTDQLIAAANHYENGVKGWGEACNFTYLSAKNKKEFHKQIKAFCLDKFKTPVIFEVFTTDELEQKALNLILTYNKIKNKNEHKEKNSLSKIRSFFKK